ncbi:MAG TPA: NAD(P)-dependent oxidoreductase [Thermohalobaculum sp.]|nr:NAD(P)-dependent oxidoreductase [Thermohalobaculum sp.]
MSGTIGFIGLGVMGEPMCRNLAEKSGRKVQAFDMRPEPLERLAAAGVRAAASAEEAGRDAEVVFLSLPAGPQVEAVVRGLLPSLRAGQVIVDTSTAPVALERQLSAEAGAKRAAYADAPVARTRAAAEAGTLSITVGAEPDVYAAIEPLLRCMGSDVLHCGPVGCGQVVKLMNNMVLFETVVALAEAMAVARRAGVDEALLLEALGNGSADSFALRNHGMKAMLPRAFPEAAFPTDYAIKDVTYALDLAAEMGVEARGARLAREILERSSAAGQGGAYFPALIRLIDGEV